MSDSDGWLEILERSDLAPPSRRRLLVTSGVCVTLGAALAWPLGRAFSSSWVTALGVMLAFLAGLSVLWSP
jgi:hypothetical protein